MIFFIYLMFLNRLHTHLACLFLLTTAAAHSSDSTHSEAMASSTFRFFESVTATANGDGGLSESYFKYAA